ncbi:hypothetical protein ES288_D05G104500v1 [Gossypium darwinii]|uniref:RecA family profile 1 domain-containing protein n=1 Tax=Gossypium darwinii TaxID=34276 RepID=A0A5D2CEQ4_GOSDA|nr:hypothetical protein ES288_D05G104500v1 [Gossypium darwinii]
MEWNCWKMLKGINMSFLLEFKGLICCSEMGPSSSGKTQVCLRTASNVARNHMVLYLDTGNSFSPQRIAYFLGKTISPSSAQAKNQFLQKVMSNISCHSVFDIFAMFDVLHQLESYLRCQDGRGGFQMRLLIVDSISSLISPVLGSSSTLGRALMTSAGYLLKKLAHQHNLAVLVSFARVSSVLVWLN